MKRPKFRVGQDVMTYLNEKRVILDVPVLVAAKVIDRVLATHPGKPENSATSDAPSILCDHGQVCILMKDHGGDHEMRSGSPLNLREMSVGIAMRTAIEMGRTLDLERSTLAAERKVVIETALRMVWGSAWGAHVDGWPTVEEVLAELARAKSSGGGAHG